MQIKIINTSDNPTPEYKSKNAAGFDISAFILTENGKITIEPSEQKLIATGLHIELPQGYYLQLKSRSGLAKDRNLHVTAGVVDTDYRGQIHVLLINHSKEDQVISSGDRIAQGIIIPYIQAEFHTVSKLSDTMRGDGGFGSTGVANEVSKAVVKETPQVVDLSELKEGDSVEFRDSRIGKVLSFDACEHSSYTMYINLIIGDMKTSRSYTKSGLYYKDSVDDFDIVRIIKA